MVLNQTYRFTLFGATPFHWGVVPQSLGSAIFYTSTLDNWECRASDIHCADVQFGGKFKGAPKQGVFEIICIRNSIRMLQTSQRVQTVTHEHNMQGS